MERPPALVLFDVNGVLYRYDRAVRVASLSRFAGRPSQEIEAAIWGSGFEDLGDAGGLDADGYLRGFGKRLGRPIGRDDWRAAVVGALAPMEEMLAIASALVGRVRLGVLTNNNLLVRQEVDTLFPALRPIFGDAVCVSAEFGLRKPDAEVYRRCLARLGVTPAEVLFIDDSAENVRGAEQAGLAGHVYSSASAWRAQLATLRLL
jgi:putative hydrolase of the HAD superfamily